MKSPKDLLNEDFNLFSLAILKVMPFINTVLIFQLELVTVMYKQIHVHNFLSFKQNTGKKLSALKVK